MLQGPAALRRTDSERKRELLLVWPPRESIRWFIYEHLGRAHTCFRVYLWKLSGFICQDLDDYLQSLGDGGFLLLYLLNCITKCNFALLLLLLILILKYCIALPDAIKYQIKNVYFDNPFK